MCDVARVASSDVAGADGEAVCVVMYEASDDSWAVH